MGAIDHMFCDEYGVWDRLEDDVCGGDDRLGRRCMAGIVPIFRVYGVVRKAGEKRRYFGQDGAVLFEIYRADRVWKNGGKNGGEVTPVEEKTENVSVGDKSATDLKIESMVDVKDKIETVGSTDDETAAEEESVVESTAKDGVAIEPKITEKTKTAVKNQIADKVDAKVKSTVEAKVGDKTKAKSLKKGDIVTFAGGDIYKSPMAETAVASCGGGRCKITEPVAASGRHRYHLISEGKHPNGKVYGWVDGKDIKEHPDYQNKSEGVTASKKNEICRFPVYYDSLKKRFVYVSAPFQKGIHDGADFGRCSDCKGERPLILACESGKVVQIRNSYKDTAGRFIKIESDHGDEIVTWQYKHLHKILVKTGQNVKVGQKIGMMGDTGGEYSDSGDYADHLHLDRRVRKKGEEDATSGAGRDEQSTDPIRYLSLEKTDRVAQLHKRTDFQEA